MITEPIFSHQNVRARGKIKHSGRASKENAHRYKQNVEKSYIYQQFVHKEKKAKQDEKIQEVH